MTVATQRAATNLIAGTDATAGAARIRARFTDAAAAGRTALIAYIVAGYPDAETSLAAALAAIDAGADVLELGLPYSDPLADGATLQHASSVALRSGATFDRSLELLARIHRARPTVPLVPMAYVNQAVGRDDPEAALRRLAEAGASGLILADLTIDEGAEIEAAARAADLALVYLVAPTTAPERRDGDRRAQRRLPLRGLLRRGHRRQADHAPWGRGLPARRPCPQPHPGRGRLRRLAARPRSSARPRRRRRHRRQRPGRRPR